MRISVKLASLALAASLLLTGCGVSITGVTLGLPATMERGSTGQATPEYAYSGATPEQAQADELAGKLGLAYASSDPAVVMVDADGNLAAVGAGTAEVTLTSADGKISAGGAITVVVSPTGLTMPETLTLTEGGDAQSAAATVEPADATDVTVTYASSDEAVATVDAAGNVTPVAAGEATVTATLGGVEAVCEVTVSDEVYTAPASGGGNGGAGGGSASGGSTDSGSSAPATSTAYGAIPFGNSTATGTWWSIDYGDSVFNAVLSNINAYRAAVGVAPLTADAGLSEIAHQRCIQMVQSGVMSHDGYQTPEIIAQNWNSAQSVVDAWAASPGHYAAMTDPSYTKCGISCDYEGMDYHTFWCVTFQ